MRARPSPSLAVVGFSAVVGLTAPLGFGAVSLGCAPPPRCPPEVRPVPRSPAFAVVLSDYASSAIALLDDEGDVLDPAWVTSGSHAPLLVTPVSGDVVLPQAGLGPGRLGWLDRYAVDVLTVVEMPGGAVVGQDDLRGDREGARTGFSPNPQDAAVLPDGRIAVTRHNPNPDEAASDLGRGNDVFVLDPATGTAMAVPLGCDTTRDGVTYFARPAELAVLRAGDRAALVVGLARLDGDFEHLGPGAVALVDASTLSPLGCFELGDLGNCISVDREPDAPDRAFVLCSGATFAGAEERRAHAGLVEVVLGEDGVLEEIARLRPTADGPSPTGGLVATGGGRAVAVADPRGDGDVYPDRLLSIEPSTGSVAVAYEGPSAWSLGLGPARGPLLLVPDATGRAIVRFDLEGGRPVLRDEVPILGCSGLPPRQIGPGATTAAP